MAVKLLTFDLDNTLWDVEAIVTRAEKVMRAWIREHHPEFASRFDFSNFMALREAVLRERLDIAHDLTQLRLEVLRRAFAGTGYVAEAAEAAAQAAFEEYFRERNVVEYFPGALEALRELREEFDIYALSNGNADIERIGLGHIFSRHFSAISVGAAKPDPRMYRAAMGAAGVAAHEIIHIGDHPEQDVVAAAAVGMKTVWVNFAGQPWPDLPRPDAEMRSFAELGRIVRRLAGESAGAA
ncbi:MAG: phosphatase [Moraxellaceae bacterium]|jgi:putative hydrolase of the HAD superfamily|nr:phosphatase [Moraxellaceae bacterium]MDF3030821.1 phosphatase [Moraxellaceae bacterium]